MKKPVLMVQVCPPELVCQYNSLHVLYRLLCELIQTIFSQRKLTAKLKLKFNRGLNKNRIIYICNDINNTVVSHCEFSCLFLLFKMYYSKSSIGENRHFSNVHMVIMQEACEVTMEIFVL